MIFKIAYRIIILLRFFDSPGVQRYFIEIRFARKSTLSSFRLFRIMHFSSCRKKYAVQLLMSFENFLITSDIRTRIVAATHSACCQKYSVFAMSSIGYQLQNETFTNTCMSFCATREFYFEPGVVDRVVNITYR